MALSIRIEMHVSEGNGAVYGSHVQANVEDSKAVGYALADVAARSGFLFSSDDLLAGFRDRIAEGGDAVAERGDAVE